jgi:hypothetical protein
VVPKYSALHSTEEQIDPDLSRIAAAWPQLPEAIKAGILAMVQAAGNEVGGVD